MSEFKAVAFCHRLPIPNRIIRCSIPANGCSSHPCEPAIAQDEIEEGAMGRTPGASAVKK
jgi:hypothetical protein